MISIASIDPNTITTYLQTQREFFATGKTKDVNFRLAQLQKLRTLVTDNKESIIAALKGDLNKPEFESYAMEIGAIKEIDYAIKHIKKWTKPKKDRSSPGIL